jgi:hypothetical protein
MRLGGFDVAEHFLHTASQMPRVRKPQHMDQRQRSDKNPLYLIQTDSIVGPVIQLRRARRFVSGNLLSVLDGQLPLRVARPTLSGRETRRFP